MEKILIEKQVWESTLNRSMVLQAENDKLKELLKECRENIAAIDYDSSILDREQSVLLNKINQVLGEE